VTFNDGIEGHRQTDRPFEQNACQLKPRKSIVREIRLMMLFAAGK
jgi:hypothetical protein